MERLTVLYDGDCAICVQAAAWLDAAPQRVRLELLDCRSPRSKERFGRIPWTCGELVAVADDGRVWAGPAAFLVTGWALGQYGRLVEWLVRSPLLPLVLAGFGLVSRQRWLLRPLVGAPMAACAGGCHAKHEALRPAAAYR